MAKKMPHHVDAERAILGSILLEPKSMSMIVDQMDAQRFYDQKHVLIYEAMRNLFEEGQSIDYASLSSNLEAKESLVKAGGLDYLVELTQFVPSSHHIETYIDLVRSAALKRDIIKVASDIAEEGLSSDLKANDFLDLAETRIFELSKQRKIGFFTDLKSIVAEVKEKTEQNRDRKSGITGLATGYESLDKSTSGLQPEELIILAARPAMGKSAFAMNLATNIAKRNKNGKAGVAIFSLEMSNDQLVTRMISNEAGIENSKLRSGHLTPAEWTLLENKTDILNHLNVYFDDSASSSINDIRAKCRKLSQEGNLDFVVIDYLQLIGADDRSGNRQEEVSKISRALKQMARELKIPVMALSQLSRSVETREDKTPLLSDLRESGSIEQDADIVMFLYREEYYKKGDTPGASTAQLIIAKNRQGSLGNLNFVFAPQYSRFTQQINREED